MGGVVDSWWAKVKGWWISRYIGAMVEGAHELGMCYGRVQMSWV